MKFCVVGAGAWGTAFALHLSRGARAVTLVPRRPGAGRGDRRGPREPRVPSRDPASPGVSVAMGLAEGLAGADVILLACPAQTLRQTSVNVRAALGAGSPRGSSSAWPRASSSGAT
jgi:glycerol-3-phosphate dehydrogenase (NAD(P)+)